MINTNLAVIPAICRQNPNFGKVVIDYDSLQYVSKRVLDGFNSHKDRELRYIYTPDDKAKEKQELLDRFTLAEAVMKEELSPLENTDTITKIFAHEETGSILIWSYKKDEESNEPEVVATHAASYKSPEEAIKKAIKQDYRAAGIPMPERPPYKENTELEIAHDLLGIVIKGSQSEPEEKQEFYKKLSSNLSTEEPKYMNEHIAARNAALKIGEALKEYHDTIYPINPF